MGGRREKRKDGTVNAYIFRSYLFPKSQGLRNSKRKLKGILRETATEIGGYQNRGSSKE